VTKTVLVCWREIAAMCGGPLAWVLGGVFLLLTGYFFYSDLALFVLVGGANQTRGLWRFVFLDYRLVTLLVLPLVTMRLFAEERKLGTLELLWTYPVRDVEIIAGKFVACLAVVTAMIAATVLHPLMVSRFYPVAVGPLVAGYLGLWLLAAAFVACGLAVSALTESQLVAGAATYGLLLFFWVITWNEAAVNDVTRRLLVPFSLFDRFHPFTRGAVDTQNVTYLVLFTLAFLALTFFALDARRWRGVR
jgi:ABC-2 type transport system permease protein